MKIDLPSSILVDPRVVENPKLRRVMITRKIVQGRSDSPAKESEMNYREHADHHSDHSDYKDYGDLGCGGGDG